MKFSSRLFVALQWLLPKTLLSDLVGALTRFEGGALTHFAIRAFVRAFKVDMSDAEQPDCREGS